MAELMSVRTRDVTVSQVLELYRRYVTRFKVPIEEAAKCGDAVLFEQVLKDTMQRDPYNTAHDDSPQSFNTLWRRGPDTRQWPQWFMLSCKSKARKERQWTGEEPAPDIDDYCYLLLNRAVNQGDVPMIHMLLSRGIDVNEPYAQENAKQNEGNPWSRLKDYTACALHTAAATSHHRVCSLLIELGADTQARDSDGNTPLHIALRFGTEEIIEMLTTPATIDCKNWIGRTALIELIDARASLKPAASISAVKVRPGHSWPAR